jgi:hypothetical protein
MVAADMRQHVANLARGADDAYTSFPLANVSELVAAQSGERHESEG